MGTDYLRIQSSVDVQTGQHLSVDDIDVDIALSNLVCNDECFLSGRLHYLFIALMHVIVVQQSIFAQKLSLSKITV
jgi:hypothetical protein